MSAAACPARVCACVSGAPCSICACGADVAYKGATKCGQDECPAAYGLVRHRPTPITPARTLADLGRNVADDAPELVKQIARFLRDHGAAIERADAGPSFEELDARAKLADLACAAGDFARFIEASPEYASLPRMHPARALVRAFERTTVSTSRSDQILNTATPKERARAAVAIVLERTR